MSEQGALRVLSRGGMWGWGGGQTGGREGGKAAGEDTGERRTQVRRGLHLPREVVSGVWRRAGAGGQSGYIPEVANRICWQIRYRE